MMMLHSSSNKFLLTLSFLSAQLVAIVSGPQYIYPTFGGALNDRFQWTPLECSFVSTACFIGVSFSGPLSSWMIAKSGIPWTLRISALLAFSGLSFVAETYVGRLPGYASLCTVYLIVTGFAGAAAYLCALDSQSYNFQQNRGLSMGLTTAAVGISGIVFSKINDNFFSTTAKNSSDVLDDSLYNDSVYHYLYFIACTMCLCKFLGSFFLGPIHSLNDNDKYIYQALQSDESTLEFEANSSRIKNSGNCSENDLSLMLLKNTTQENDGDQLSTVHIASDCESQLCIQKDNESVATTAAFFKHSFGFSLFCTLFTVLGLGYIYLANIGKIIYSSISLNGSTQELQQHLINLHVALFSLGNCGSRAIFGAVSDLMTQKVRLHRLWIFVVATVLMLTTATFLISYETISASTLKLCTLSMASAYGIVFGVAPAATTEFGGTKAFVKNWGYLLFAPAFGSQIFNILFGYSYDDKSKAQKSENNMCYGTSCFKATFQICIVCGLLALVILLMAIRKARSYNSKRAFA
ncbi:major facilitator superfamily domain-containing protein [Mycotypha africana]|uniref:major facilitator superfamily domain-containing protein n=1 Tax=Mycotypha africana TaxID=64632 RepID=UPI002301BC0D|nr:major facilitator superfamily domain-containing protein [Mycotypha africana]KAI8979212.1 major facilitator superfamily domain-containing protein [Mycotypha africana]